MLKSIVQVKMPKERKGSTEYKEGSFFEKYQRNVSLSKLSDAMDEDRHNTEILDNMMGRSSANKQHIIKEKEDFVEEALSTGSLVISRGELDNIEPLIEQQQESSPSISSAQSTRESELFSLIIEAENELKNKDQSHVEGSRRMSSKTEHYVPEDFPFSHIVRDRIGSIMSEVLSLEHHVPSTGSSWTKEEVLSHRYQESKECDYILRIAKKNEKLKFNVRVLSDRNVQSVVSFEWNMTMYLEDGESTEVTLILDTARGELLESIGSGSDSAAKIKLMKLEDIENIILSQSEEQDGSVSCFIDSFEGDSVNLMTNSVEDREDLVFRILAFLEMKKIEPNGGAANVMQSLDDLPVNGLLDIQFERPEGEGESSEMLNIQVQYTLESGSVFRSEVELRLSDIMGRLNSL